MRRVLEVLYSFRVGGSEVVGLELARQMAGDGAQVSCTAIDGITGPLRARCADFGLDVVDLGLPIGNVLGRNGLSLALSRRLRSLSLDAIHLQHFVGLNKLGLAARMARIPRIVVTEHSEAPLRESKAGTLRLRLNWRLAHRITVIHEGIKTYLMDNLRIPASRITVIPNGIDLNYWHRNDRAERRAELGLGPEFTFVFVGRLVEVKNVPGIISAFLSAQERSSQPLRLIVVGDGPDRLVCESLVYRHPLAETVTFVGEQLDTRRYLAAADAFVLNSRSEGTPRALMESMALGLPAICPAVGGIPEMLQARGWLTVPGEQGSLESALLEVASRPDRSRAVGAAARAFAVKNYSATEVLRRYQTILSSAGQCREAAR
jgi:glycosyltransferase involved in cell wall biosynthesis